MSLGNGAWAKRRFSTGKGHEFGNLVWDQGHTGSILFPRNYPLKDIVTAEKSAAVFTAIGTTDDDLELCRCSPKLFTVQTAK